MYVPSHAGSIRVAAQVRRYAKSHRKMLPVATERTDILDSVSVVKPSEIKEEDWSAPSVEDVIYGRVTGFRIRQSNKFASVEKIREKVEFLDDLIAEHSDEMNACRGKLYRLIGSEAHKILDREERKNAGK